MLTIAAGILLAFTLIQLAPVIAELIGPFFKYIVLPAVVLMLWALLPSARFGIVVAVFAGLALRDLARRRKAAHKAKTEAEIARRHAEAVAYREARQREYAQARTEKNAHPERHLPASCPVPWANDRRKRA